MTFTAHLPAWMNRSLEATVCMEMPQSCVAGAAASSAASIVTGRPWTLDFEFLLLVSALVELGLLVVNRHRKGPRSNQGSTSSSLAAVNAFSAALALVSWRAPALHVALQYLGAVTAIVGAVWLRALVAALVDAVRGQSQGQAKADDMAEVIIDDAAQLYTHNGTAALGHVGML